MNDVKVLTYPLSTIEACLLSDKDGRFTVERDVYLDDIMNHSEGDELWRVLFIDDTECNIELEVEDFELVGYTRKNLRIQMTCLIKSLPDPIDDSWSADECMKFLDVKLGVDCATIDWIAEGDDEAWQAEVARRLDEIKKLIEDEEDEDA